MLHTLLLFVCVLVPSALGWRSVTAFRARELTRSTRLLGWALVPVGAYLAGVVTLVSRIASAVSRWLVRLVFNPLTWAGVVTLAVAAALILGTGLRTRRAAKSPIDATDSAVA